MSDAAVQFAVLDLDCLPVNVPFSSRIHQDSGQQCTSFAPISLVTIEHQTVEIEVLLQVLNRGALSTDKLMSGHPHESADLTSLSPARGTTDRKVGKAVMQAQIITATSKLVTTFLGCLSLCQKLWDTIP